MIFFFFLSFLWNTLSCPPSHTHQVQARGNESHGLITYSKVSPDILNTTNKRIKQFLTVTINIADNIAMPNTVDLTMNFINSKNMTSISQGSDFTDCLFFWQSNI